MKNRTNEYSKVFDKKNESQYEKLLFENDTYAVVRNITATKVQIGLITHKNDKANSL
ncbi:MAG: hypothetical protein ACI9LM_005457 [Alteromonadaceae bacterium]|jgi:hypothetical protein